MFIIAISFNTLIICRNDLIIIPEVYMNDKTLNIKIQSYKFQMNVPL